MKNITLVGRLKDYADKAADSFYKTAGRIASPIIDTVASIDFAGSYFNNSSIPEYAKFQALRRNIITDDSAIAQIGGEFPAPGKKMELGWKDFWKIAAAVGVLSAAGGGYAYMKKKDIGFDDIDSGIAYAKAKIFGSAFFGGGVPVAFDNVVPANASVTATPTPDYYDSDFKVGIMIEKYKEYPLFANNVTNMFDVMKEKTPERYKEAMNVFKQKPKKIVRTTENYNYNSEREIGLTIGIEQLGGSDDIKKVLAADAYLYAEMMGSAPELCIMNKLPDLCKEPRFNPTFNNNRYEGELYQHSNLAKYYVDAAGIQTKENMNKWLKEGYWFKSVEGRMPTPEDTEGVDIGKYLIQ